MHRLAVGFDTELAQWLAKRIPHFTPTTGIKCIGVVRNGKLVAAVAYSGFSEPGDVWGGDVEMSVAADTPRWWSRDVGKALLGVPFKQFGCARATARVRKRDKRTRRFVEGIGFRLEGVMRHALKNDDMCVYGLTRRDWENGKYV